jgi:DNA-directed RNA polymerase specialized sigma24 family protein
LEDRSDLWRLLATITVRKACHYLRDEARRNGQRATGTATQLLGRELDNICESRPSPDVAVQMADDVDWLLRCLQDSDLQAIAIWKLEGYTNHEIAAKMQCSRRTVERRVGLIRRTWCEVEAAMLS